MVRTPLVVPLSRRTVLQLGAGVGSALALAPRLKAQAADEPHFFLQIFVGGGLDQAYLFDARPLAFKANGKAHSYLTAEPTQYTGSNGGVTFVTALAAPLLAFKEHFTLLNGVHMSATFDGHDQNVNVLLTGSPTGGDSVLPYLNAKLAAPLPIDYLQLGRINAVTVVNNTAAGVVIDPRPAAQFSKTVRAAAAASGASSVAQARLAAVAAGADLVALGAGKMLRGLAGAQDLMGKIGAVDSVAAEAGSDTQLAAKLITEYFRNGICRSAFLTMTQNSQIDTHATSDAQALPTTLPPIIANVALVIQALKDTPFDGQRSFLDVTTVLVASEFSRTNFQAGKALDQTGTDHNTYGNSVFLGGKGVKGGLVIGATDLDALSPTFAYTNVSPTHKKADGSLLKKMGKPFSFASLSSVEPTPTTPAAYDPTLFLTYPSVANTIFKLFSVGGEEWWPVARNGPKAATLDGLLT